MYVVPEGMTDAEGILLSDILPTGFEIDVAPEAVGLLLTFTMATEMVRPGASVANIDVHGKPAQPVLNELWIKNIDISLGLVNTNTFAMLLTLVAEHRLPVDKFVTHESSFDQVLEAYDVLSSRRRTTG